MKRVVRMCGKDYDIILEECCKICVETAYSKDGVRLKVSRIWHPFDWAIEYYRQLGFVVDNCLINNKREVINFEK